MLVEEATKLVEGHTVVISTCQHPNPDKLLRLRCSRHEQPDLLCEGGAVILQVEAKRERDVYYTGEGLGGGFGEERHGVHAVSWKDRGMRMVLEKAGGGLDGGEDAELAVVAVSNRYDNDGAIRSPLEMSDFRRMVRPSAQGHPGARQVRAGRCIR